MMVCAGLGFGVDYDGSRPELLRADARIGDRGDSVHAGRLWRWDRAHLPARREGRHSAIWICWRLALPLSGHAAALGVRGLIYDIQCDK